MKKFKSENALLYLSIGVFMIVLVSITTAVALTWPTSPSKPQAKVNPIEVVAPTITVEPTPTESPPMPTLLPVATPTEVVVPTATPEPSATPVPTSTPNPTSTPAPTAVPTVTPTPDLGEGFIPTWIRLERFGTRNFEVIPVERLNGEIGIPKLPLQAGWDSQYYKVGQKGPAVIDGHIDWNWQAGIFARLTESKPGDKVIVGDGIQQKVFVAYAMKFYTPEEFNQQRLEILGSTGIPELRLISCAGEFIKVEGHYNKRVVVFLR